MVRHILLGAVLFAAACDTPTSPRDPAPLAPSAEVWRNVRFERQTFAISDCTGEFIAVEATFHVLTAVTYDAAGGYHVTIHRNIQGTGTNLATGAKYIVSQVENNVYSVDRGADEQTSIVRFNLVGQGGAPDELVQATFHITITPDGDVTAWHDSFTIKCGD
jgi:hypothetical protein